jgi:hypothetical protein
MMALLACVSPDDGGWYLTSSGTFKSLLHMFMGVSRPSCDGPNVPSSAANNCFAVWGGTPFSFIHCARMDFVERTNMTPTPALAAQALQNPLIAVRGYCPTVGVYNLAVVSDF